MTLNHIMWFVCWLCVLVMHTWGECGVLSGSVCVFMSMQNHIKTISIPQPQHSHTKANTQPIHNTALAKPYLTHSQVMANHAHSMGAFAYGFVCNVFLWFSMAFVRIRMVIQCCPLDLLCFLCPKWIPNFSHTSFNYRANMFQICASYLDSGSKRK